MLAFNKQHKTFFLKAAFIFPLFVFCFSAVEAQTDSTKKFTDTFILEPVILTAFGGAASWKDALAPVALLNKNVLQQFDNKTLVPVFNTVAGVRMEERSPGSYRLSIRGSLLRSPFGVRNIKVYWNNIPLTDAGGNTYLNLIDVSQLSSIEIIKGPASSLYGANTGGAVLLNSDPSIKQKNFNANIESGSYGLLNEQIVFNYQTKKFSFSLQQSHYQNNGYRRQSAMRKDAVQGNFNWNISNKEQLSGLLFYTELHYETPGGLTKQQLNTDTTAYPAAVKQHAGVYNKTAFAGFSLQSDFGRGWSNTTSATINHTDFKNPFTTSYEYRNELNYGARTVFELNALRIKWLSGAEWQQNISHINTYENNGGSPGNLMFDDDAHVAQYFLFTQLNIQLKNFTIQAGASANQQLLKYNRVSDSVYNFWQHQHTKMLLAPRLSLLYEISNNVSLFAILSKGFSPPTLAEIRPSTNQFYNLQPEYGWNIEGGVKGSIIKHRLEFQASVYSFNLKHAIVQQQDSTGAVFFVNAGGTKQMGVEVWLQAYLIKNNTTFIKSLVVSNSFSYQPYKFSNYISGTKNLSGNSLTGVPKYVTGIMLDVVTRPGFYFNSNYNYTSSIPLTDANDAFANSYNLLQLKLGYKFQLNKTTALELYTGADNLLNETYSLGNDLNAFGGRYYNPAPKRNYFGGIKIDF